MRQPREKRRDSAILQALMLVNPRGPALSRAEYKDLKQLLLAEVRRQLQACIEEDYHDFFERYRNHGK